MAKVDGNYFLCVKEASQVSLGREGRGGGGKEQRKGRWSEKKNVKTPIIVRGGRYKCRKLSNILCHKVDLCISYASMPTKFTRTVILFASLQDLAHLLQDTPMPIQDQFTFALSPVDPRKTHEVKALYHVSCHISGVYT